MGENTKTKKRIVETCVKDVYSTKNVALEGLEKLRVNQVRSKWKITYTVDPETNQKIKTLSKQKLEETAEEVEFDLREITLEQLAKLRQTKIPSFVLKLHDKYYHAKIHRGMTFFTCRILGGHKCCNQGKSCARISAATDEEGGCARTRNGCRMIENYPWIKVGYESFNTHNTAMIVCECEHYEEPDV